MKPLPAPLAYVLITLASLLAAAVTGLAGAVAFVYLYDRGTSKGNDLAVALIGLHVAGTFTFITMFTLLWTHRGNLSWRGPIASYIACICALAFVTALCAPSYDDYYAVFFYAAWLAVAISGGAALLVSRYILSRAAARSESIRDSGNSL